jgi:hypothetical protein
VQVADELLATFAAPEVVVRGRASAEPVSKSVKTVE